MEAFSYKRRAPLIVLVVEANLPLVQSDGGRNVTEEFFDNDRRVGVRANLEPYYDFIHGEPYSRWY